MEGSNCLFGGLGRGFCRLPNAMHTYIFKTLAFQEINVNNQALCCLIIVGAYVHYCHSCNTLVAS